MSTQLDTRVTLPLSMAYEIWDHCLAGVPNEACGVIVGSAVPDAGGEPLRFVPMVNIADSAGLAVAHPRQVLNLAMEVDESGEAFWAFVHSHTFMEAIPSVTDVDQAGHNWPASYYIIVSVSPSREEGPIRAWRIREGQPVEIEVTVDEEATADV